jgi:hypothetical protein
VHDGSDSISWIIRRMRFSCADPSADNCGKNGPAGFPFVLLPLASCVLLPPVPFRDCETPLEEELLFPLLKGEPMRERRADKGTSGTAWVQCRPGSGRMVPSNSRSRGQALQTTPGVCNCKAHHENTCGANYSLAFAELDNCVLREDPAAIPAARKSSVAIAASATDLPFPYTRSELPIEAMLPSFSIGVRMAAPCPARWHDAKYRRSSCFSPAFFDPI